MKKNCGSRVKCVVNYAFKIDFLKKFSYAVATYGTSNANIPTRPKQKKKNFFKQKE